MPMENFLVKKLGIQKNSIIFNQACKKLWGSDHFLDEMTVILSSERKIGESEFAFIGETTFLREYYKDNTIISWSHCSTNDLEFWQKMPIILEENYVQQILIVFGLDQNNIQYFYINKEQNIEEKYYFYEGNSCKSKELKTYLQNEINIVLTPIKAVMLWKDAQNVFINGKMQKTPSIKFWYFVIHPTNDASIRLLPQYTEIKKGHVFYVPLKELFSQLDEEKINFIKL